MHKVCTSCGMTLKEHEVWADTTSSVVIGDESFITGDVLCEYCFDNAYPADFGSDTEDLDTLEMYDREDYWA
jgi:hypothetical protein